MRAVLDTNILVSALIAPEGRQAAIVDHWLSGGYRLVTSPTLLEELTRVVSRGSLAPRLRVPADHVRSLLALLSRAAEIVAPDFTLDVLEDEPDNRVLEAAVAGGADFIVTGDAALLALGAFRSVRVVSPAQFLAELEAG